MSNRKNNLPKQRSFLDAPATELMMKVAEVTGDTKKIKKAFSLEEIEEIMNRRANKNELSSDENNALRIATRANKKWVKAQTVDDFSKLMRMEEERRDRARNLLRPAKMAPVTYKLMVDFITQISPKIKNLERRDFFSIGEDIMQELEVILEIYYTWSDGQISTEETGIKLLTHLNRIKAGMAILQEMSAWDNIDTAAMLGEYLMFFRDQIMKDFKITIGKSNAKS